MKGVCFWKVFASSLMVLVMIRSESLRYGFMLEWYGRYWSHRIIMLFREGDVL